MADNTAPMWLVYEDDDGVTVTRHYQPWQDVATAGVLVNDIGNDMTLVGWTAEAPEKMPTGSVGWTETLTGSE